MNLENRLVNFRIRDIYHPEPGEVLERLYGFNILQGRVTLTMPGPEPDQMYLVVQVAGLDEPVIVPSEVLSGVL